VSKRRDEEIRWRLEQQAKQALTPETAVGEGGRTSLKSTHLTSRDESSTVPEGERSEK